MQLQCIKKKMQWITRSEWEWSRLEYKRPIKINKRKYRLNSKVSLEELKTSNSSTFYDKISIQNETTKIALDNIRDNSKEWDY